MEEPLLLLEHLDLRLHLQLLRDGLDRSNRIHQAELLGSAPRPELSRKEARIIGEAGSTAVLHDLNERVVNILADGAERCDILSLLRQERVHYRLVLALRLDTTLNAVALDEILEAKATGDHTDATNNAVL